MNLPESPYYTEREFLNYRDKFTIQWMVTRACNFKCEYCYQPDTVRTPFKVDDFIEKLKGVPQPFRLVITGGEPLIFPWMIEVIQKVGNIGGTVSLQTNLSIQARELADNVSPGTVDIIQVSYHPRQRILPYTVQNLIDDIHYLRKKGFNLTIWHIDYPKLTPEQFLSDCKILYDAGIVPVRKRYNGVYNENQYIGDSIFVEGKRCYAGYKAIAVWENFDISPCDHDRTVLGNLFTGFNLAEEPVICNKPFCGCLGRELIAEKIWDDYYKREFGECLK